MRFSILAVVAAAPFALAAPTYDAWLPARVQDASAIAKYFVLQLSAQVMKAKTYGVASSCNLNSVVQPKSMQSQTPSQPLVLTANCSLSASSCPSSGALIKTHCCRPWHTKLYLRSLQSNGNSGCQWRSSNSLQYILSHRHLSHRRSNPHRLCAPIQPPITICQVRHRTSKPSQPSHLRRPLLHTRGGSILQPRHNCHQDRHNQLQEAG